MLTIHSHSCLIKKSFSVMREGTSWQIEPNMPGWPEGVHCLCVGCDVTWGASLSGPCNPTSCKSTAMSREQSANTADTARNDKGRSTRLPPWRNTRILFSNLKFETQFLETKFFNSISKLLRKYKDPLYIYNRGLRLLLELKDSNKTPNRTLRLPRQCQTKSNSKGNWNPKTIRKSKTFQIWSKI